MGTEVAHEKKYVEVTFVHLVEVLYDIDALSEAVIVRWFNDPAAAEEDAAIRKKCEKFVAWLQEEEEDDEDDD
eukprot:NODE_10121_length_295_cov_73.971545_g8353_i0.p2 GENE.NODE_10121_length_295_cov_73.971545_g8353_i0~~NODE_10121_length_295_cov_73.971545_g8353_i0.p2  ORF type:complete len:81 (-),score=37.39 NODE_10121_length_295_cov_73.971545_g8353_i0:51-269(-)